MAQSAFGLARLPMPRRPRQGAATAATLGRLGDMEVRLARDEVEIREAQRLRYRVFYEEMSAVPGALAQMTRRDRDAFDALCDHVLVLDHSGPGGRPAIVGTYRLLRQDVAERAGGFYSAGEYDLAPLLERSRGRFLELGRSCVLPPYRTRRTIELLWHGVWRYTLQHGLDVMIGCASLEGTDPDRLALPLSFLHHHAAAPEGWRVRALPRRHVAMDRMRADAIDMRAALAALPPLIKGYLRLGAFVGEGAVVDAQFGTTDVFMILPVSGISQRYIAHFGADAGRHAA